MGLSDWKLLLDQAEDGASPYDLIGRQLLKELLLTISPKAEALLRSASSGDADAAIDLLAVDVRFLAHPVVARSIIRDRWALEATTVTWPEDLSFMAPEDAAEEALSRLRRLYQTLRSRGGKGARPSPEPWVFFDECCWARHDLIVASRERHGALEATSAPNRRLIQSNEGREWVESGGMTGIRRAMLCEALCRYGWSIEPEALSKRAQRGLLRIPNEADYREWWEKEQAARVGSTAAD